MTRRLEKITPASVEKKFAQAHADERQRSQLRMYRGHFDGRRQASNQAKSALGPMMTLAVTGNTQLLLELGLCWPIGG